MAKAVATAVLDAALNQVKNGATRLVICAGQPTSYADVTTRRLAEVAVAPADLIVANGDTNGRKLTVAAKTGIAITANGTADHLVLANPTTSSVDVITTCPAQALSSGGTVDAPSWKYEINNPT